MEPLDNALNCVAMSESLEDFQSEYHCMETIGEGGFGKVRKAVRRCDKKNVAIKYIANSKITSWHHYSKTNQYVPMEIVLMCRCRNVDGVIKIIKYFHIREHKGWYIVMERFENHIDLFDHITNKGQISEKDASNFIHQLINILIQCHSLGVCHRDIKDENIILNLLTNKIYLIDFGAGGILHDGLYSEFDGTRVYSPPEWIQNKRYHASTLETWSLGILLYDMVCGNLPYDNDDSIVNCCVIFRKPISRSCQDLIVKCLEKNPEKRLTFTEILNHRWLTYYSKLNNSEIPPKCTTQSTYFQHSHNNLSLKKTAPTFSFMPDSNSRRISGETSPFVTPQSSGFEDTCMNESTDHNNSNHQKIVDNSCPNSNSKTLQQKQRNSRNNSSHTFTNFNFKSF